jgi:hypothetical protein
MINIKKSITLLSLTLVVNLVTLTPAFADNLNLTTGTAEIVDETSVSLKNLSLDDKFYNAVIQLNLDGTYQVLSATQVLIENTAKYQVEFESTWSSATHPDQFPSNLAHLTGLIGVTHQSNFKLWENGMLATPGIKSMAETGSKSPLNNEIDTAINDGNAEFLLSGDGVNPTPGTALLTFDVTQNYVFVSLVSMIAPSPDWFIGVSGVSLIEKGQWGDELIIPLHAYDAGTDNGQSYLSSNNKTDPQANISRLKESPFIVNNETPTLGRFIFKRI